MSKKFTFKTVNPIGYRSFDEPQYQIKLNKIWIGNIDHEFPHKIRLMVMKGDVNEDGNPSCPWKWIAFKTQFESIPAAKNWLNENREWIFKKYKIVGTENQDEM